jgi:hypothetical protein
MDNENLRRLRGCAYLSMENLSRHSILGKYWDRLSLIMKGSTARGYSDRYSDIDFVFFSDAVTKSEIVSDYIAHGLSQRKDGIFFPLDDAWSGHYNLDTYEDLEAYFINRDMVQVWEYSNVNIMHDSQGRYERTVEKNKELLFADTDSLVRKKYLDIQLNLNWMQQPLRRADICAAIQYGAHVQRYCCQIMYLLNGQGYPPDKWLFYYLKDMCVPDSLHDKIISYGKIICGAYLIEPDLELLEYGLYAAAVAMVEEVMAVLWARYGAAQWIDEWALYA